MKLGLLFSGGKDSTYAGFLATKYGHELACLITIESLNKESFMFHTPSISATSFQAEAMGLPIVKVSTEGEKEIELVDLKAVIMKSVAEYGIKGVVTGAVESVYQASRIQKICFDLGLVCFNPLWLKNQEELLNDLIKNGFEVIITGVFAEGLDEKWLGRKLDSKFIEDIKKLNKKYGISLSGEGGETESFVLNCPLFANRLIVKSFTDHGSKNSWRREICL